MIPVAALESRARLLQTIRRFFDERGVIEVVTPTLGRTAVPDLHIDSLAVDSPAGRRFLQTSPEYFIKRLLAEYPRPVFQIGPVFRAGETGLRHNTEFQMLEWYRPGLTLDGLAEETVMLIGQAFESFESFEGLDADGRPAPPVLVTSYRALFESTFGMNPHDVTLADLRAVARTRYPDACEHIVDHDDDGTRNDYLDVLFAVGIEPSLRGLTIVSAFPSSQAALARLVDEGGDTVAARFECYIDGVEIANAYDELRDADTLRLRFLLQNELRRRRGKPEIELDESLLVAIGQMPDCVGIALGVDRLLQVVTGVASLDDVMTFSDRRL